MKGYTDFMAGFFGSGVVATKPIGAMKYMDWNKVTVNPTGGVMDRNYWMRGITIYDF